MRKFLIDIKFLRQLDLTMLITSILITIFGALNIYSVTHAKLGFYYFKLQMLWLLLGLILTYVILIFDYNILGIYSKLIYWSSVASIII